MCKWIEIHAHVLIHNLLNFAEFLWWSSRLWLYKCLVNLSQTQLSCCSSWGFAALLLYINCCEFLNGWRGKRQQVRHSSVCFMSTLGGNMVGRQRARVLALLRWSEEAKTWLSKEFLQDQLDPAEQVGRSGSRSRPALCPMHWCKMHVRRESEHVKHLQGSSSLSVTKRISLSQTRCAQCEPLLSSGPCTWQVGFWSMLQN